MDSATLGFLTFGFYISFYFILVESRSENGRSVLPVSPALPPSPHPPSPLPPPPPLLPPPRHPPRRRPPPRHPPNPHHHVPPRSAPHQLPPPAGHKMNAGKKVGLLFAGIAAIMQIGVIGFLVFKRRQILKSRYETCS